MHASRSSIAWRAVLVFVIAAASIGAAGADLETRAAREAAGGRFGEAAALLMEAADAHAASGARDAEQRALVGAAEHLQALGSHRDAVALLVRARTLAERSGRSADVAVLHAAIGNAWVALGAPDRAMRELAVAVRLARELDAAPLLASASINLGNAYAAKGEPNGARSAWGEAADVAAGADLPGLEVRALANAARLEAERGGLAEARALFERAEKRLEALPREHERAALALHLAVTLSRLREAGEDPPALRLRAFALLTEAEAIAAEVRDERTASQALGYLAAVYEEERRLKEALTLTDRALVHAGRVDARDVEYRWRVQAGRLQAALGDADGAIDSYARATELIEGLRHSLVVAHGARGDSFRSTLGPIYFRYVDLLLARSARNERDAPERAQGDLVLAQQAIERLKAAELRDYFEDECVDAALARRVAATAASGEAVVVYPVVLPDRLELLVSSGDEIRRRRVDVAGDRVVDQVRAFRQLLEKRTTRQYLRAGQQLYRWLIAPLEADLRRLEAKTLVFVPDGALATVPMSALHDGERFLVERYAVAVTPGLELSDPRPLDRAALFALLGGLSEGVQGFPALPSVPDELAAIHAQYDGELLLDEGFVTSALEERLSKSAFNVVHIASHAEFSADAESAFVLTHDGRLTMDELATNVGLFRFRDTPLELLVLSACETATGDERAALGLSGIAVKAGARSALGTLWVVNDEASSRLIAKFYEELRQPGQSRAEALRHAQRAIIADPRWGHPQYWSPFILIGNWL